MQGLSIISNQSSLYNDALAVAATNPLGIAGGGFTITRYNNWIAGSAPVIPSNTVLIGYVNLNWFFSVASIGDVTFQLGSIDQPYKAYAESLAGRTLYREFAGMIAFNNVLISGVTQIYISVNGYQINYQ
jgi:hypothetical protein